MPTRPALFLLASLTLLAQSSTSSRPISLEITGVVLNASGMPLEGATVEVYSPYFFDDALGAVARNTTTGESGKFQLQGNAPGAYWLSASKKGYLNGTANFTASATDKKREVRITLQPGPQIKGRIEDSDTGEPVPGLPLTVWEATPWAGEPNLTTDHDGNFLSEPGTLGTYRVHLFPRLWAKRVLTEFTPKDVAAVDTDYEESYWPPGSDLKSLVPIQVTFVSTVDLGSIRLRKTTYYRAKFAFPAASVPAGIQYEVSVTRLIPGIKQPVSYDDFEVASGRDFLLLGLLPGSYLATFQPKGHAEREVPGEEEQWAFVPFTIGDENVSVTANLHKGVDVEARVLPAEGAGELPKDLKVFIDEAEPKLIDEHGRILLKNVPVRPTRVGFWSLPPGWYLSEVRYKNIPQQRLMDSFADIRWDGTGSIELVIDSRSGSVQGTVTNGDKPAAATVVIALWPPPNEGYNSPDDFQHTAAPPDGKFQFKNLAPGDYRIFAIPLDPSHRYGLDLEQVDQLAPRSDKITVPRGGSVQIDLKLR